MSKCLIAFVVLVTFSLPVTAAPVYKWVDEKGTVNFSEDLGKVPKKYRKKVTIIGGDDTNQPQVIETKDDEMKKIRQVDETGKKDDAQAAKQEKKKKVYGGRDEDSWKLEFGKLKADIQSAENQLAELKSQLNDTSKMSRNEYLTLQNTVKSVENSLQERRKKLEALTQSANNTGVPADLR